MVFFDLCSRHIIELVKFVEDMAPAQIDFLLLNVDTGSIKTSPRLVMQGSHRANRAQQLVSTMWTAVRNYLILVVKMLGRRDGPELGKTRRISHLK